MSYRHDRLTDLMLQGFMKPPKTVRQSPPKAMDAHWPKNKPKNRKRTLRDHREG